MSLGMVTIYKTEPNPGLSLAPIPLPKSFPLTSRTSPPNGINPWSFSEQKVSYCLVDLVLVHICLNKLYHD